MAYKDTDKILIHRDGVDYQADIGPLVGVGWIREGTTLKTANAGDDVVIDADSTINGVTVGRGGGSVATNIAVGSGALLTNTTGNQNTAVGLNTLRQNTTGIHNTAVGVNALYYNTTGSNNTAVGLQALVSNTEGTLNTAIGYTALNKNTTGTDNTAIGQAALFNNTEGQYNTAVGSESLFNNSTGEDNVAVGNATLYSNTTGGENTALGISALFNNTTGSGNIGIGGRNSAGVYAPVSSITTQNDRIVMGSNTVTNAYVQVAWTVVSDARDKTNFAPVPHGLDFVKQLQPTQYEFRVDRDSEEVNGPIHYGFKAQDILALEGDHAVIIDTEDPDHLKYKGEHLVPVLVNAIQEQQVVIDALVARLEAVEAKIV